MHAFSLLAVLSAPLLVLAKTDLTGCTSTIQGPSVIYYVPDTGELCEFLDCGGGRAPVKTTVPGCPLYSGTATYSPNYLAGFGPNAVAATPSPSASSVVSPVVITASSVASSVSSRVSSPAVITPTPFANSTVVVTSSRTTGLSTASRASNTTTGTATAGTFGGDAGHISARLGLVGFLAAVVALL